MVMSDVFTALGRKVFLLLTLCALHGIAHAAAGCPWVQIRNSNNLGIVDSNAAYWNSLMPDSVAPGTVVQVDGTFAQLRFFNFTIYHQGDMVDHLADGLLYPVEGGIPNTDVSALPYSNGYTDHYRITIKYQDPPAQREANTLYAGSSSTFARVLMMRAYLPNNGVDQTGGVGLPQLTQINPDGSRLRYDLSSPNLACPIIAWFMNTIDLFTAPEPGTALNPPAFTIMSTADYNNGNSIFPSYANFDAGYGYLMTNSQFGDLLLIRAQMPATPGTSDGSTNVQSRYLSVCGYRATNRYDLGCLDDLQLIVQGDGDFNLVISTADKRPAATGDGGAYNWLPWYKANDRTLFIIRQLLADPGFTGNYQNAGVTSAPLQTLGQWAPQATYCDLQTFNTYAPMGGSAVFAACQAASKPAIRNGVRHGRHH